MKILVTGAAGFIGSHTAEGLKALGHDVTGIDNFSDYYDIKLKKTNEQDLLQQGIKIINADLSAINFPKSIPTDFDYIFHLAAQPGNSQWVTFDEYLENNFTATYHLLEFALRNKNLKLFVNISTSSVYGLEATYPETFAPQPASYYGVTKLAAEQLVLRYARMDILKACSLRLYSVYGPRERPDKLYTKLISSILLNKEFPLFAGSEKHLRSFTYVGDILKGIVSVIDKEKICNGEVFNLGTEIEHTTQYGIDCVKEILQKEIIIKKIPGRPGDQLRTKADINKARTLLDYDPATSLKEGLKEQVLWCKKYFL